MKVFTTNMAEGYSKGRYIISALCLIIVVLQWLSLEVSVSAIDSITKRALLSNIMGICIVLSFDFLILLISRRIRLTLCVTSVFFSFFSLINDFVLRLHGSPVRISELGNVNTALHVVDAYNISFSSEQLIVTVFFVIELLLIFLSRRIIVSQKVKVWKSTVGVVLSVMIAVLIWHNPLYSPIIGFSWTFSANSYGYVTCLVKDAMIYAKQIERPDDYSEQELDRIENYYRAEQKTGHSVKDNEYPDVILILNETFYDPAVFDEIGLKTDKPYLEYYYHLAENKRAHAVVPYTGTNSTEYELLTSNSKALVNPSAPFVYYDLSEANSVVNYLKKIGYETWAMHNAEPENYTRNVAYENLGFDHIMFYEDMLPDELYGNRRGTDRNDFGDLIKAYEDSGDGPKFMYMLTIQNHGGYEQNDDSYDTIHCRNDYGQETDDMNEFLTSISMTDEAIRILTDYYSKVDRRVIIAMLGDHPPSFMFSWSNDLFSKDGNTESYIKRNMTPLMMWTNYSEGGVDRNYVTASDIVPMMLHIGQCPLSPYYQQILKVHAETPVHIGEYIMDANDKIVPQEETGNYAIHDYLIMEYNNLQSVDKRRQFLFEP